MRVVAYFVAVVVTTALLMGGGVLVAVYSPRADFWLGLATTSLSILVIAPLTLGSLTAYWDVDTSPDSRTLWRRWSAVVLACEVVAAGVFIAWAIVVGLPWWIGALCVAVSGALVIAAPFIGRAIRRTADDRAAQRPAIPPVTGSRLTRRIAAIPITFVGTLAVALTALLVFLPVRGDERDWWTTLLLPLQLALIAAACAAIVGSISVNRDIRALTGGDFGRARRLSKTVANRKPATLPEDERSLLPDYAVLLYRLTAFQVTWGILLYGGLALTQVTAILTEEPNAFRVILLVGFLALLVLFVIISARTMTRAHRYAVSHPVPAGGQSDVSVEG